VSERNLFAIEVPHLGTAPEVGLESFPKGDRPPVIIPFFAFRIMVGLGLIMR
jgi:cytochrome d ubiquinol oxidase subunit I